MKQKIFIVLKEYLSDKCIEDIIDIVRTKKYLNQKFDLIFNSSEFNIALNSIARDLCCCIIEDNSKIITEETKLQITDKIIEASLASTINNSCEVIESVNLKEITEKQIEIMNPKELHELFISFSGPLFKKLYLYGSFGSVFGLNLWIPVLLGIKESISTFNIHSDEDEIEESKSSL